MEVSENKLTLDFTNSKLPIYEVTLGVSKLKDYSGNILNSEEVKVVPILDTNPPEVVGLDVSQDGKSITVYFNKNVKGNNRNGYDIRDEKNNRVSIGSIEGSGRVFTLNFGRPLPAGTNTITIENIVDNTSLENKLIPYMQEIYMKDVEVPKVLSYSGKGNTILLRFSKEMDIDSLYDTNNYVIKFNNQYMYLPEETDFIPLEDELTYMLYLPVEIGGKKVDIGKSGNLVELEIRGLKAINDMLIEPVKLSFDSTTEGKATVKSAELIDSNTIVVTFDQPIIDASSSDFSVPGRTVVDVYVDFNETVILYLKESDETHIEGNLSIKSTNSIETFLGSNAKGASIEILDKVAPRIKASTGILSSSGRYIYLPFTEGLKAEIESLFKQDIIIEVLGQGILDSSKYSTDLDINNTRIRIRIDSDIVAPDVYIVRLVDDPKYIMDEMGNIVEYDGIEYFTK